MEASVGPIKAKVERLVEELECFLDLAGVHILLGVDSG